MEVELARQLADLGAPVGALEPRVDPLVYIRDGFAVTLWTYYEPVSSAVVPGDYAHALELLHVAMRAVDGTFPRFTDRIAEAERIVARPDLSPDLPDVEREFLSGRLQWLHEAVGGSRREQLLHGEPHPGNILSTRDGPRFIDLETCCTGPVEFDLAHVPDEVCEHYLGVDHQLLDLCRQLVLAMVAAWRWDKGDQFPNRLRFGEEFIRLLRAGPPWPSLDAVTKRLEGP